MLSHRSQRDKKAPSLKAEKERRPALRLMANQLPDGSVNQDYQDSQDSQRLFIRSSMRFFKRGNSASRAATGSSPTAFEKGEKRGQAGQQIPPTGLPLLDYVLWAAAENR